MTGEICVCLPTGTAPSIEPKHKTVREGKGLSLSCTATGNPKPRIKWKKNGNIIIPDNRIKIRVTDTGSKLRIRNSTIQDTGTYRCVARNHHGPSHSGKAIVTGRAGFNAILSHNVLVIAKKIATNVHSLTLASLD